MKYLPAVKTHNLLLASCWRKKVPQFRGFLVGVSSPRCGSDSANWLASGFRENGVIARRERRPARLCSDWLSPRGAFAR